MTPRGRRARHRAFGRAVFFRFDADRMRRRSEPVRFDDLGNEPGRALPNRIPIGKLWRKVCPPDQYARL